MVMVTVGIDPEHFLLHMKCLPPMRVPGGVTLGHPNNFRYNSGEINHI